jgi:hypothetical protein
MAVYKLFPAQDASIYSAYPAMNTGLDPILDVSNYVTESNAVSRVARSLIQFDQDQIDNVIRNIASVTSSFVFTASLKSFIAKATNVTIDSYLEVYPIQTTSSISTWYNGTGQYLDNAQNTTGVSWAYQDYSGSNKWVTNGWFVPTTGSYSGSSNAGGGQWWYAAYGYQGIPTQSMQCTQSFSLRSDKDLNVDVTKIVKAWYSSSLGLNVGLVDLHNNGFIIKWENDIEFTTSPAVTPQLSYYSVDTNTIYPPQLEIKWRDFSYNQGTLPLIQTPELFVSLQNNSGTYFSESISQFRLNVRPQFPLRTFETSSMFTHNHVLPSASYWAIKDLDTNEFVVDFDTKNTQISCDPSGSYFTVYMNGLEPERYYQILIQTTIGSNTIVLDENYYFKVVNG